MNFRLVARVVKDLQDGAIYGDTLIRANACGGVFVFDLGAVDYGADAGAEAELTPLCELRFDGELVPHSNAMVFGKERYCEEDEFPLLYSNIYNNYAKEEDPLCGVCCVYRLQREGDRFFTTLVQTVEVGFTEVRGLWRSEGEVNDVRPYGNFTVDAEAGLYYGFVMLDGEGVTRYFAFPLPKLTDGELGEDGVRRVILTEGDILRKFDTPYHNYIQGACMKDGRIYSVEGFGERIHPVLRIIDAAAGEQALYIDLYREGLVAEAEMIDVHRGRLLYGDAAGNIYVVES